MSRLPRSASARNVDTVSLACGKSRQASASVIGSLSSMSDRERAATVTRSAVTRSLMTASWHGPQGAQSEERAPCPSLSVCPAELGVSAVKNPPARIVWQRAPVRAASANTLVMLFDATRLRTYLTAAAIGR
jgi:hypothetical protein